MEYGITPVFYKNYTAFKAKNADGSRKYKYIINTGSSRSSKTYSIIELIHRICENNKNIRATAWRDTKKDCRDTIWKDYQKILSISRRLKIAQRNKTEAYYSFPETESYFEFHGTDDEEKVHGLTQQVAWINEPYKISKDTFDQIDMRSDVMFIDWNPKKNHWIDTLSKQDNAIVIHSTFLDNPFCPEQSRIKILSYKSQKYAQVVIDGKIKEADLTSYDIIKNTFLFTTEEIKDIELCRKNESASTSDDYKWSVYGLGEKAEKPNKIYHGWQKIEDSEFFDMPYGNYYGLDFGSSNPTAMVEVKFDGKDSFFFKERIYTPAQEMGCSLSELLTKLSIDKKTPIICDSAEPDSINDLRLNGFNAVPAVKGQGSVNAGIKFLQKYKVYFTKSSSNLESEYDDYEWEIVNGVNLDRPLKKDDHLLDAARYCCTFMQYLLHIKK